MKQLIILIAVALIATSAGAKERLPELEELYRQLLSALRAQVT